MKSFKSALILISALSLGSISLAHAEHSGAINPDHPISVLADFGGEAGLDSIVSDMLNGLTADERTEAFFTPMDVDGVKRFKSNVKNQFCEAIGGGCTHPHSEIYPSNAGININKGSYNVVYMHLRSALDKNHVHQDAQYTLLEKLVGMYIQVGVKK